MKNALQEQANKELRRIRRFIREAEKRGFEFPENAIPKEPKRITSKYVQRLKSIKPDVLYKRAKYTTPSGETISGTKGRTYERKQAAKKGQATIKSKGTKSKQKSQRKPKEKTQTKRKKSTPKQKKTDAKTKYNPPQMIDNILRNIEEELNHWSPPEYWTSGYREYKEGHRTIAQNILQAALNEFGRKEVAGRLENAAEIISNILDIILYDSEQTKIQLALAQFAAIINGKALTPEESARLTEAQEYNESYDEDESI